jgi:hypothetical protein
MSSDMSAEGLVENVLQLLVPNVYAMDSMRRNSLFAARDFLSAEQRSRKSPLTQEELKAAFYSFAMLYNMPYYSGFLSKEEFQKVMAMTIDIKPLDEVRHLLTKEQLTVSKPFSSLDVDYDETPEMPVFVAYDKRVPLNENTVAFVSFDTKWDILTCKIANVFAPFDKDSVLWLLRFVEAYAVAVRAYAIVLYTVNRPGIFSNSNFYNRLQQDYISAGFLHYKIVTPEGVGRTPCSFVTHDIITGMSDLRYLEICQLLKDPNLCGTIPLMKEIFIYLFARENPKAYMKWIPVISLLTNDVGAKPSVCAAAIFFYREDYRKTYISSLCSSVKGQGKQLFDTVCEWTRERGGTYIFLQPINLKVKEIYRKNYGMEEYELPRPERNKYELDEYQSMYLGKSV